jgi:heptosyltransferase-2
MLPSSRASARNILVIRFSALGDVVLTAPALDALRQALPEAHIAFAVKERFAPLVRHNPNLSEVIALREGEGVLSFARRIQADQVLDLHGSIRSKLLRLRLFSKPAIAWKKRELLEVLPVKLALRPYHARMTLSDRYHQAVERLVGRELPRGRLQYFLGPDDVAAATAVLGKAGINLAKPLLGLSPGANWATKRWPASRFAGLARRAMAMGAQVAVQGSAGEWKLGAEIAHLAPGAVNLCGALDLSAMGGFISLCTAFAANDTGPMHVARALGVPTLAIFGSTDPAMFDFSGHSVLFAGVDCSPCSFFGRERCPRGHFRCMLDLDEESAWRALEPLFRAGRLPLLSA